MSQIFQQLTISLKGGQTVVVSFKAEKTDGLNPQIEAFLKAMGEKAMQGGNFLFQGSRAVLVRLADVSCAEVVSFIRKKAQPVEEEKKAGEAVDITKAKSLSSRSVEASDVSPQ